MKAVSHQLFLLFLLSAALSSCVKESDKIDTKDYPEVVGKIIRGRCATSGCHNDASYDAAGGLNLSTWEDLFKGTRTGASVIPYRADYSPFLYFVNTYADLGPVNVPTMPYGKAALSRDEVIQLRDWINQGAPNSDGFVKFSDNPNRSKFYVAHTACGVVAVFDAATRLPMRYITVVKNGEQCTPHLVRISPDGKYWYVCFNSGGAYLRRYNTSDDSFAGELLLGTGEWNTFAITPDSKKAFVIDWSQNGKIATCDLQNMILSDTTKYQYYPHGSAVSPNGNFLYVTATQGNFLYKITISDGSVDWVALTGSTGIPGQPSNTFNPHDIIFSPDGSKYYVSCQTEHTVRVFDAVTDDLITTIAIDGSTLEMSISPTKNLMFVSSWDSPHFAGVVGAVAVIDITTNTLNAATPYINAGTQPHGIAVDEARGQVYVANRNIDVTGPLPHHSSVCGGRNGYITYIDLNSLQLRSGKTEISVDPYSIALRP
ncbi:MAG: YncE family protein [Bacteroidia bacterium]